MSNPFFSVIIPAHNAENHFRKLLDSIVTQSFKNFELVVICDNCTDNTERIARDYGAITDSVSFGRDGLTRDRGLDIARGDWILFADDDDWFLHEFVFQQLHDFISSSSPDIDTVAFGTVFRSRGYIPPSESTLFKPRIDHVWSSAWKRTTFIGARFGNAIFCSDTYFLKAARERSQSHALFNMPIYYYNFMRPGSQTDLFCKGIIRQSPVAL